MNSQEHSVAVTAEPAARWLALDVFRALAVLWMIQGHTFTALLAGAPVFEGGLGRIYRTLHGLTAPMFLCGAGLAYGIVRFGAAKPAAPGRMLRRALMLFAIGTALQMPSAPLSVILQRRDLLAGSLRPAALQVVAACLLLAELLRWATGAKLRTRFAAAAALAATLITLTAPWLWNLGLSKQYLFGSWIDGQTGAQFPCVPWVCFFLLGAVISTLFGASLWRERWFMPLLGLLGLGASALCYWQYLAGERLNALYGEHAFWLTSPMFVGFRAGLVLVWLSLLSVCAPLLVRAFAAWPSVARVVSALSRHSLVAYVVHLTVLYGLPPLRVRHGVGPHFTRLECTQICALVLLVSVLSVLSWERLRELVFGGARKLVAVVSARSAAPRDPLV